MKTSRRDFLGTIAAVPVAVSARAASASTEVIAPAALSLRHLIGRYEHFRDLSKLASDRLVELYRSPGKPQQTHVVLGEVDSGERGLLGNRVQFRWPNDIDAYYAAADDKLEWLYSSHGCNRTHYLKRKAELPSACVAAKALLAERISAHDAWEAQFDIPAALAESDRLCEIEVELDSAIAEWHISTLDEARLVAGHILRSHADDDLDGDVEQFLRNVAGEIA